MIPEHMEPQGLSRDATPIADFRRVANDTDNAVTGSQRLLEAMLAAQGCPVVRPVVKIKKPRPRPVGRPPGAIKRRKRYDKIFRIQREVAKRFRISAIDLAAGATRMNSDARQVAMYLSRSLTDASYTDIARHFNRDHSTVMSNVRAVQKRIDEADNQTIRDLNAISKLLAA